MSLDGIDVFWIISCQTTQLQTPFYDDSLCIHIKTPCVIHLLLLNVLWWLILNSSKNNRSCQNSLSVVLKIAWPQAARGEAISAPLKNICINKTPEWFPARLLLCKKRKKKKKTEGLQLRLRRSSSKTPALPTFSRHSMRHHTFISNV